MPDQRQLERAVQTGRKWLQDYRVSRHVPARRRAVRNAYLNSCLQRTGMMFVCLWCTFARLSFVVRSACFFFSVHGFSQNAIRSLDQIVCV